MTNPLLSNEKVPAFDRIKAADFIPAIDQALADVTEKLAAIRDNPAPATFANTVVPLEGLFDRVNYIRILLGNLGANAFTKELSQVEEAVSLKVSAFSKNIFQDQTLGARFQNVYQNRWKLALDDDDTALLKSLHDQFESSGAFLSPQGQQKIRDIDAKLISLAQKFGDNKKAAPLQQAVLFTDRSELAGLSDDMIDGFAEDARKNGHAQGWLFIPERLLVDELLEKAENSNFRRQIFESLGRLGTQAPYDNRPVIAEMQQLRHDYAQLLGYDHYAAYARSRAMTTDLPAVRTFLKDMADKALPQFERDMKALEKFSAAKGGPAKLEPWDVPFWAVRQCQALHNFDANDFSKHLELENVMAGLFSEATHLFDIEFRENTGQVPVMHPDIRTYNVVNRSTGAEVGILHVDMFARPESKIGGAWMNVIQNKDAGHPNAVIFNMNIAKPPEGKAALVALGQYITIYHEMGHSLQGLLGTNVKYKSQQGTNAPSDFVEIHSMINERRAVLEENLKKYALHVDTGLPPSAELLAAMKASSTHFQAREVLKIVQNSLRDLEFHSMDPATYVSDKAVEDSVATKSAYDDHIRAYQLARFDHLFADAHSGYAAGYVNYLLAELHAADGFEPFEKNPYDPAQSKRLSDLYNRGSGGDPAALYRQYRGRDATPDAMLREKGIGPAPQP